jgi:hypothetical protein
VVAKDLKKVEGADDPNENPFQPAEIGSADCKDLDELPGISHCAMISV